jgi:hypothetical protein
VYLHTPCGQREPLWFGLSSDGKLAAFRLTNFNHFECLYNWTLDRNTAVRVLRSNLWRFAVARVMIEAEIGEEGEDEESRDDSRESCDE